MVLVVGPDLLGWLHGDNRTSGKPRRYACARVSACDFVIRSRVCRRPRQYVCLDQVAQRVAVCLPLMLMLSLML